MEFRKIKGISLSLRVRLRRRLRSPPTLILRQQAPLCEWLVGEQAGAPRDDKISF